MRTETKTVRTNFDYMHCDDFARYLERMAAKGWHFKKWNMGLIFEKGEPETAVYAVEVFTKASENDMRPEPHTEEFAEYCKVAGWELIDAKRKFCIFKRIHTDAVELFTPEERVINAFRGTCTGYDIALLILYGINALLQWGNLLSFADGRIFSQSTLYAMVIWSLLFLEKSITFLYAWHKKKALLDQIQKGNAVYIGNGKNGKLQFGKQVLSLLLAMFVFLTFFFGYNDMDAKILCVGIVLIGLLFSMFLAKKRPESTITLFSQIVFAFVMVTILMVWSITKVFGDGTPEDVEHLPLQISDYRPYTSEIENVNILEEKNLFGSVSEYYIISDDSVYYEVYRSKYAWILDKIWETKADEKINEEKTDCANEWGALEGYRNLIGMYYIRYEDVIFILHEDADILLSERQITVIRDKMKLR